MRLEYKQVGNVGMILKDGKVCCLMFKKRIIAIYKEYALNGNILLLKQNKKITAIYMIGLNGYLWGLSLLNIFFMLRLKIVFGTTVFQVHNGFWMIFVAGLVFQGVTAIYSTERFMSGWDKDARQLAIRLYTWHNICNIVTSGIICVLFVKRILVLAQLENTAASMFRSNNDSGSDVVSVSTPSQCDIGCSVTQDGNIQKRMIKQEMLNLIVRYLVCATFAMISTAMVVIFGYIRSEIIGSKDLNARAASFWVRIADSTVNLICIYLQFPFAKTPYYKCCKICNNCFQQCSLKLLGLNVSNGKTNMFESKSSISTASANAVEMTIN
eukprot:410485_1